MPTMSAVEQAFCRSAPWRVFAKRIVLPWALQGHELSGSVLELGGGSGATAEAMLERFPGVTITVTDYDTAMVEAGGKRLARFADRAHVERADATCLQYPDESFDSVVSFIMLHHVLDWEGAVREAVRVTRPGGIVLGYDLTESALARLTHRLDRSPARLMTDPQLRSVVAALPVDARVDALRGRAIRFALTKLTEPTGTKVPEDAATDRL